MAYKLYLCTLTFLLLTFMQCKKAPAPGLLIYDDEKFWDSLRVTPADIDSARQAVTLQEAKIKDQIIILNKQAMKSDHWIYPDPAFNYRTIFKYEKEF